ncbi:hypothetical protein ACOMHN_036719 [Nucella lapillus]
MDRLLPDSGFSPHYGAVNCWLNRPLAIVCYFVAPCGLICCVNAFFVICTVRGLRQQRKHIVSEFKKECKVASVNDVVISFKILLLVGITWTLGLLAAVLDSSVVWVFFTLINASLGFFIALVLLCNRRILALLWRSCRPGTQESTTVTGVHTTQDNPQSTASAIVGRSLQMPAVRLSLGSPQSTATAAAAAAAAGESVEMSAVAQETPQSITVQASQDIP